MTIQLKSRRTMRAGAQVFTFSTPTGDVERSLSAKRSEAGGRLAFCFYRFNGKNWECSRVVADTPRNAEYLRAHERTARVVVFVDVSRRREPGEVPAESCVKPVDDRASARGAASCVAGPRGRSPST